MVGKKNKTVLIYYQACHECEIPGDRGSIVVKALCYKSVGRWFDPIDIKSFRSDLWPQPLTASNRNEYQEYFLEVKAAGA